MVDFAMDIHKSLYPDQVVPAELPERRSRVVSELKRLQTETEPIFKIFSDNEVQKQLQNSRDHRTLMQFLIDNHDVSQSYLTLQSFD
ncbi:Eukaryotic translation initiation factor 3 subunit E-B [Portunus trituberculatus]|uniref:Eukaryotic translation initiation factor 3 subunit E-B n=1 Tax=Portunus trituberculatus TaxID=210409 RepID=A0A5B7KG88_PORTR|nr:Eukaryotic translation initiation factor 3 subunit E-B [Portunus trituberculatus]